MKGLKRIENLIFSLYDKGDITIAESSAIVAAVVVAAEELPEHAVLANLVKEESNNSNKSH